MDRYSGKPLLRLIECYALDKIDQLDAGQRSILKNMEPKLRSTYNVLGSWQEIVASQLELDAEFDSQIRAFWAAHLEHARASGVPVDPNEFAILFVDQNFHA